VEGSSNPSTLIALTGLQGADPLAFLAALSVSRVLDHQARRHCQPLPRLAWKDEGWRPAIHGWSCLSSEATFGGLFADEGWVRRAVSSQMRGRVTEAETPRA
jgi:hypothetical protein